MSSSRRESDAVRRSGVALPKNKAAQRLRGRGASATQERVLVDPLHKKIELDVARGQPLGLIYECRDHDW